MKSTRDRSALDVDYDGPHGGPEFTAAVAELLPQEDRWRGLLALHARDRRGLCEECCGQLAEPISSPCLQRALALHAKWTYEDQR